MNHRRQGVIYLVLLLILLPLFGCSLKYTPRSAEEFLQETLRLEKRARTHEDPAARAEAQLELARLYLHHRNPQLNCGRALQEFEAYQRVTTMDRQTDEIQNWLHALREMERQERETARLKESFAGLTQENEERRNSLAWELRNNQELQTALERLQAQVESLERTSRSLKDANEKMKETVEKLKNLDLQMEEKRKAIK
jgi:hypothetical protein